MKKFYATVAVVLILTNICYGEELPENFNEHETLKLRWAQNAFDTDDVSELAPEKVIQRVTPVEIWPAPWDPYPFLATINRWERTFENNLIKLEKTLAAWEHEMSLLQFAIDDLDRRIEQIDEISYMLNEEDYEQWINDRANLSVLISLAEWQIDSYSEYSSAMKENLEFANVYYNEWKYEGYPSAFVEAVWYQDQSFDQLIEMNWMIYFEGYTDFNTSYVPSEELITDWEDFLAGIS